MERQDELASCRDGLILRRVALTARKFSIISLLAVFRWRYVALDFNFVRSFSRFIGCSLID